MNNNLRLALYGLAMLSGGGYEIRSGGSGRRAPLPRPRPCVECKKPHTHNNSFCSAECCSLNRKKVGNDVKRQYSE